MHCELFTPQKGVSKHHYNTDECYHPQKLIKRKEKTLTCGENPPPWHCIKRRLLSCRLRNTRMLAALDVSPSAQDTCLRSCASRGKRLKVVRLFFNPRLFKFTPMGSWTLGPEVLLRLLHTARPQTRSLEAFVSCNIVVLYGWHSTPFNRLYIVTFLIVLYVNTMPDFKMKSLVYCGFIFCNFMCLISINRAVIVLLK
jgi:hypothetical protein